MSWYVIQVATGREEAMASLITRVARGPVLEECFVPKYATERKYHGIWVPVEKPLFSGYLIAITKDPEGLAAVLRSIPEWARILTQGDEYVPLAREEEDLLGAFTSPGRRVVPMSMGVKDGDRVVVTSGPLVGHEGMVKSIWRRKSTAVLEIDICGRKVATRVGLGVLSKEKWLMQDFRWQREASEAGSDSARELEEVCA